MKVIPSLLATVVLSSILSLPAFAAEQPKSITVLIDQQKLALNNIAPINDQGSIIVPLRAIFEKLGLEVTWDAKTGSITGSKQGLVVKLQVGSKKASINGTVKPLTAAPKVINNVTYVPLRFVGEATGNEVSWDAKQQAVIINKNKADLDPSEITAFFDNYVTYSNKENYEGIMSLIAPQSPFAGIGPQLKEQMEEFGLTTSIEELDIIDLQANEATVHTVETTHKIKGPFKLDDKAEYVYSLIKDKNSKKWNINNIQITAVQYTLPEETLAANISVPKADEDGILAVLQANLKHSNEENLEGILSTIDETSPLFEQNKQIYSQIFQMYDFLFTIESSKIINYTENEAAVYVVQTTKKLKGPTFQDNRTTSVTILRKNAEGKWKLEITYPIKSEGIN